MGLHRSALKRALRAKPHVYSAICRTRLFYSQSILGAARRRLYQDNRRLLATTPVVAKHSAELSELGYTVIPAMFPSALMEHLLERADRLFRELKISTTPIYPTGHQTIAGLSYDEIARTQKVVAVADPLIDLPEYVDLAFHPEILSITANFLRYVPPVYQALVVRDFPHNRPRESSNFHKDNDERDSLQIFIYLSDVSDHTGFQVYVPRSHGYDARSCRPQLSDDEHDGRLSDDEVARTYPAETWATLKPTRGSVGFISGNGIHKGPAWGQYGDAKNVARTVLRIDVHGMHRSPQVPTRKIARADFDRLSALQRLFTNSYFTV